MHILQSGESLIEYLAWGKEKAGRARRRELRRQAGHISAERRADLEKSAEKQSDAAKAAQIITPEGHDYWCARGPCGLNEQQVGGGSVTHYAPGNDPMSYTECDSPSNPILR